MERARQLLAAAAAGPPVPVPSASPPVLMVFVDGLGLGAENPATNPLLDVAFPSLRTLLRERSVPVDARLGVPGLPQSATGQTALLTGQNAAAIEGRHVEGFPGPRLRRLIRQDNVFIRLRREGRSSTFANAYFVREGAELNGFPHSVTTVAALSAFGDVRRASAMERNEAVYHDLTRARLRPRGYTGPLVRPEEAAEHLLALAAAHAFTLFEYFETDRAGHSASMERARAVLAELDRFLGRVLALADRERIAVLLTSDHGNIEDMSAPWHTENPVPLALAGAPLALRTDRVRNLADVTPELARAITGREASPSLPVADSPASGSPAPGA